MNEGHISNYSVSQSSLEQIFNMFALEHSMKQREKNHKNDNIVSKEIVVDKKLLTDLGFKD
jgi:hypothetical protein